MAVVGSVVSVLYCAGRHQKVNRGPQTAAVRAHQHKACLGTGVCYIGSGGSRGGGGGGGGLRGLKTPPPPPPSARSVMNKLTYE